jgi:DNA mismatch endonuclease (patch repair protein)
MDTISKEKRSLVMARVRSKHTKFERAVADGLKKFGKSFTQHADVFGKPDIVSRKKKVAIFLDSCFWHGCRWHCRTPKSKRSYWLSKIERNKTRAKIVNKKLRKDGWYVARFWEHQFQDDFDKSIKKVKKLL